MNIFANKSEKDKSPSTVNVSDQEISDFKLQDNRPEAIAKEKIHPMANNYSSLQKKKYNIGVHNNSNPKIKNLSDNSSSMPIQRANTFAKVVWDVTHVVKEIGGSIFGKGNYKEGEINSFGELSSGEVIMVDDEDIFISRRGANQEDDTIRDRQRKTQPSFVWLRVIKIKGEDVRGLNVYVRKETILPISNMEGKKEKGGKISALHQAFFAEAQIQSVLHLNSGGLSLAENVIILQEAEFKKVLGDIAVSSFYDDPKSVGAEPSAEELAMIRSSGEASAVKTRGITYKGKVYLKTSQDLGNLIHEGIHFYCTDNFQKNLCGGASQGINEGVTEYFARKVARTIKVNRNAYESEFKVAQGLAECLGEDFLVNAYFNNDIAGLKQRFLTVYGASWDAMLGYIQASCKSGQRIPTKNEIDKEKAKPKDEDDGDSGGLLEGLPK